MSAASSTPAVPDEHDGARSVLMGAWPVFGSSRYFLVSISGKEARHTTH